jgi:flagellar biosynthetic protein FlhB
MADSSKTEKATPKRREKAREQGQVHRSRELPSVLAMVGAVSALAIMSHNALGNWTLFYRKMLDTAATTEIDRNGPIFFWGAVEVFRWTVPVLASALLLSVSAGLAQGGINFAPAALQFKFEKFNPAGKVKQIFSLSSVSNLLKSLLPFFAIAWVAESCISSHWGLMVRASSFGLETFASTLGNMMFEVAWKACLILLVWSGIDYFLSWMKMEGDLKMTREEIREENKQTDGNPLIKQRIRRLQRRRRRRQTLAAAATATVVVTNPTHYAVALRYTPDMETPIVVAKGMNLLAQEIKALAAENGITILENKPLAQALYKTVEVDDPIPAALYQAVADILVIVFRAQAEVRRQEEMRRNRNAFGDVITR